MLMLNNEIFGYPPIDLTYDYNHGLSPWKLQLTWEKVLFASRCSFRDNGYPFVMFRPLYNVYLFTLSCFFRDNGCLSYWVVSSMKTTIYLCLVVSSVVMAIYSCWFVINVFLFRCFFRGNGYIFVLFCVFRDNSYVFPFRCFFRDNGII